jgi:CheY-like chemotaxis protein
VIGNLELALDDVSEFPELRRNIDEAIKAAQGAAEISRFMLTYVGQAAVKKEEAPLVESTREVLRLLSASLLKDIPIETKFPSEEPVVLGDAAQIKRVLTTLFMNAAEAVGEQKGYIAVTVGVVEGTQIQPERWYPREWKPKAKRYACLSVSDTGCGMDAATMDKVFDPFFSTKFTGRGMGLPVALGIVRMHGGAISIESQPGRGAAFRVFLPTGEKRARPSPAPQSSLAVKPEGEGLVLVVDDMLMVRTMAEATLRRLGYEVVVAADGFEALAVFRERKDEIRFVLLDLGMPGMNGWETLTELRALRPDIPVIFSSGYGESQAFEGEHPETPRAFLQKPYTLVELKRAIGTIEIAGRGA